MAISANSVAILDYVKTHEGDYTAKDIAAALGLDPKSVNGSLTGLQKKGFIVREAAGSALADGKAVVIKYIRITEEGKTAELVEG